MGYWGRNGFRQQGSSWHGGSYSAPSDYWRQRSSEWKPPDRDTLRNQEIAQQLRAIDLEEGEPINLRAELPSTWTKSSEEWQRSQDSRQNAARLKCVKMLAGLADTGEERSFYLELAGRLNQKASNAWTPEQRVERAKKELAETRAKEQRAAKHAK